MKVLMITGDRNFCPGNPRYDLQQAAVEELAVLYWGRGALWPRIPQGHFDVVTVQDPFWRGHVAYYIASLKKAHLNIQIHTDLSAKPAWRRLFAYLQLRHADSVRVVSEKIKQQILRMGVHIPIYVLPVYVDVSRFKAVVPQPHTQKTILWFGRFEDEKDPLLALQVFDQVRKSIDTCLIMLGKGSMEGVLRARGQGLPVKFPGWQDPAQYLSQADAVLCTSREESWGASIVEALAAGVAVVAPNVGIARQAGAIVVSRERLAAAVSDALRSGARGQLALTLPSAEEWVRSWKEALAGHAN